MTIGSLTLPMSIDVNTPSLSLIAVLWRGELTSFGFDIHPTSILSFFNTPLWFITLAQLVFVWMMVKFYQQESTGKRTFLAFIISWLPILVLSIALTIPVLWNPYYHYAFRAIPLPLLLSLAITLILVFPPPRDSVWIDEISNNKWWANITSKNGTLSTRENNHFVI